MKAGVSMKKLICAEDIELLAKQGQKNFCIEPGAILTPSAKDAAKAAGIEICEKDLKNQALSSETCTPDEQVSSDLIYGTLKSMLDKGLLNTIPCGSDESYSSDSDKSGLKLVYGESVNLDSLDTGTPGTKAFYREVIGSGDGCHMGAGFLEIDSSTFEWELSGYEELDYVIEGTLTVSVNGKPYTAHKGDVFFIPSGSKVVWSSPDKARMFYATFPV